MCAVLGAKVLLLVARVGHTHTARTSHTSRKQQHTPPPMPSTHLILWVHHSSSFHQRGACCGMTLHGCTVQRCVAALRGVEMHNRRRSRGRGWRGSKGHTHTHNYPHTNSPTLHVRSTIQCQCERPPPLTLSTIFASLAAPASTNAVHAAVWPLLAAQCSGV